MEGKVNRRQYFESTVKTEIMKMILYKKGELSKFGKWSPPSNGLRAATTLNTDRPFYDNGLSTLNYSKAKSNKMNDLFSDIISSVNKLTCLNYQKNK